VALDHADDQSRAGGARGLAECFGLRSRYIDRLAPVLQECVAALRRAIADARAEVRTLRVSPEHCFRHYDELRPRVTDRLGIAEDSIERGCCARSLGADLESGDRGGAHSAVSVA